MHPLDGPRAKVERAKSQLKALHFTSQGLFKRYPYYGVKAESVRKTGYYNIRAQGGPPTLPVEWGVIIGEIAHNLRSALDGLAWQLALVHPSKPGGKPYDRTAFPIYRVGRTKRRGKSGDPIPHFWGKQHGLQLLKSTDRKLWKRIEAFQPYKKRRGGRRNPLFLLENLNNTDKHRLITVLAPHMAGYEFAGLAGGGSKFKLGAPLDLNATVGHVFRLPADGVQLLDLSSGQPRAKVQHEVQVDRFRITPRIHFGDSCDAVKGLPVIRTFQNMADDVSRIIESFAPDLSP